MKKKLLSVTFAVMGIIMAIMLIQLNGTCNDELLNANVEALAGPDITVTPCEFAKKEKCKYAELAKGPEGDMIVVGNRIIFEFRNSYEQAN